MSDILNIDKAGFGNIIMEAVKAIAAILTTPSGQAIQGDGRGSGDDDLRSKAQDDENNSGSGHRGRAHNNYKAGLRSGLGIVHYAMGKKSTLREMDRNFSITMKSGRTYFLKAGDRFNLAKVHVLGMRIITLHNPFKTFRISKKQAADLVARSKIVEQAQQDEPKEATARLTFAANSGDSVYIQSTRKFEHSHMLGKIIVASHGFLSIDIAGEIVIVPENQIIVHGQKIAGDNIQWTID